VLTSPVLLLIHYYAVETYLCEIALDEKVDASRYGSFSATRLSVLFACLEAVRHFFEAFDALPAAVYFDVPYSTWTFVSHFNVVLSKLSLCTVDGWDLDYVAETVDFNSTLDKLKAKVDEALKLALKSQHDTTSSITLPRCVPLIFLTIDAKIGETKAAHEARRADLARRNHPTGFPTEPAQPADNALPLPEDLILTDSLNFFDLLDEPFWAPAWT
jgi:hypothetical protein